ncbi:MAG: hypothetical protein WCB76_04740, partial [Acidobacteriaceae bacterium]
MPGIAGGLFIRHSAPPHRRIACSLGGVRLTGIIARSAHIRVTQMRLSVDVGYHKQDQQRDPDAKQDACYPIQNLDDIVLMFQPNPPGFQVLGYRGLFLILRIARLAHESPIFSEAQL